MTDQCTMGVGCNEYGVCYAEAHGQPEQCPLYAARSEQPDLLPPELLDRVAKVLLASKIARCAPGYRHLKRDFNSPFPTDYEDARAVAPMLIAHGRELENAEVVAIIAKHGVASCNCMTKTPEAVFHLETCPYQRVALILDEIDEHRSKP